MLCWQYDKKRRSIIHDRTLVNNFCTGVRSLRPVLFPILALPSPWSLPVFPDKVLGVVVDLEVDWPLVLRRPTSCGVVETLADDVNGVLRTETPVAPAPVSAGPPTSTKNDSGRATPAASAVGLLGSVVAKHTPLSPFSSTIPNPSVVGWRHRLLPTTNDDDVTSSVRVPIQVLKQWTFCRLCRLWRFRYETSCQNPAVPDWLLAPTWRGY